MSFISPQGEQSSASEIELLTALGNLAVSGATQAIKKTGVSTFENVSFDPVGNAVWGSITGTLSNQSDLQTAFNNKQSLLVNSAGLKAALDDETGTGLAVFNTSPTLITPDIGTATGSASLNALIAQTMYIGTTAHVINRASAAEGLAGITSLTPGADFTLTQNSVNVFTSENTGAIVDTLYLKAGNVGIGTTDPSKSLHLRQSWTKEDALILEGYGNGGTDRGINIAFYTPADTNAAILSGRIIAADENGGGNPNTYMSFSTNGTTFGERLRITSSGNVGIGVTVPTAVLMLKAGTATASTAPLKFTSGINLTTAEAGAMEYNGTNLFFTRAGTIRENVITESAVNAVSPTSPNRTITVNIDGSTYYIAAKTTND